MSNRQEQAQRIAQARTEADQKRLAAEEAMRQTREAQMPRPTSLLAETAAAPHRRATDYPWDGANPKYRLNFQARTPEPLYLKIKWLAERYAGGHKSMQELVQTGVERYVAELLHAELEKDKP